MIILEAILENYVNWQFNVLKTLCKKFLINLISLSTYFHTPKITFKLQRCCRDGRGKMWSDGICGLSEIPCKIFRAWSKNP